VLVGGPVAVAQCRGPAEEVHCPVGERGVFAVGGPGTGQAGQVEPTAARFGKIIGRRLISASDCGYSLGRLWRSAMPGENGMNQVQEAMR
jgi:hypothetical protein